MTEEQEEKENVPDPPKRRPGRPKSIKNMTPEEIERYAAEEKEWFKNRPRRGKGNKPKKEYVYKPHAKFGKWKYFFLEEKLYRTLDVKRLRDEAHVFNYTDCQYEWISWSYITKKAKGAFSRNEVLAITQRSVSSLRKYILAGVIQPPQYKYKIPGPKPVVDLSTTGRFPRFTQYSGPTYRWMYSEDDIYSLMEHLERKELNRNKGWPTRKELALFIDYGIVLKAVLPDGREVQMWDADGLL